MPYPPEKITTIALGDYRKLLQDYASDPTLRDQVLRKKARVEHSIHSLYARDGKIFFAYMSDASISELNFDLRQYQRTIDDLPKSIHSDQELNNPLVEWKRYLETTRDELTRAIEEKGGGVSAAQKRVAQFTSNVQAYLEARRLLEEQRETDVKNNPTQEKEIRRRYRKAIDALNEGEL